jgi:hypothetical protein
VLLRYWQRPRTFVWRSVRISQQRERAAVQRYAQEESRDEGERGGLESEQ